MSLPDQRRELVDALEYAYGPLLVSAVFAGLLATQDPVFEVFLAMADDITKMATLSLAPLRAIAAMLSFIFVPVMLFIATHSVLFAKRKLVAPDILRRNYTWPYWSITEKFLLSIVGRLPLLGAGIGLLRAARLNEASTTQTLLLGSFGIICIFLTISAFWGRTWAPYKRSSDWFIKTGEIWATVMTLTFYPILVLPQFADMFGPVTVASIAVAMFAFLFAALTEASSKIKSLGYFPLIFTLIALVFAANSIQFAIFGLIACAFAAYLVWKHNRGWRGYAVVAVPAVLFAIYATAPLLITHCAALAGCNIITTSQPDTRKTLDEVVQGWTPKDGHPIRILAAQGGGLFTAYQTAYFLATKADTDPDYLDSLFAISGVSGGSFGMAAFWAIYQDTYPDEVKDKKFYRNKVRAALRRDYLSAPLTGLLFRDAVDSVIPVSAIAHAFNRPIDRGRLLEKELESNLRAITFTDHLSKKVEEIDFDDTPILFFNATNVQSGDSIVNGPVKLQSNIDGHVIRPGPSGLSISTAAVLSARFPLVTPPGRYVMDGKVQQIVDGGYFDNSGIETAVEIITALDRHLARDENGGTKRTVELISFDVCDKNTKAENKMKGTLAAPLGAFVNSWVSRRKLSERRLKSMSTNFDLQLKSVPINTGNFNFTVSWLLTDGTFDMIEREIERDKDSGPCRKD